jgi:putative NADH-flavin reductase
MKIVIFGATGWIGSSILKEALARGHQVTAVLRDPSKLAPASNLKVVQGDIFNADSVAAAASGQDAILSAFGPGVGGGDPQTLVTAARALIEGAKKAGVKRLIVINGAGSLEVAPGVQLIDTPQFPEDWKPLGRAHAQALAVYRACDLNWTAISPAAMIQPGERTGNYRTGTEQLVVDAQGNSTISTDDFAIAMLDELENPKNAGRRMTVAY